MNQAADAKLYGSLALRAKVKALKRDIDELIEIIEGMAWKLRAEEEKGDPFSLPSLKTEREFEIPNLNQLAEEMYQAIMAQRESLVKAFIAATGLRPDQIEQVEQVTPDGQGRRWYLRRRRENEIHH